MIKHLSHFKALIQLRASQILARMVFPRDLRRLLTEWIDQSWVRDAQTERGDGTPPKKARGFVGWCVFLLVFFPCWRVDESYHVVSTCIFGFHHPRSLCLQALQVWLPKCRTLHGVLLRQQARPESSTGWVRLVACGRGTCDFFDESELPSWNYLGSWEVLYVIFLVNMINHLTILLWILREFYRLSRHPHSATENLRLATRCPRLRRWWIKIWETKTSCDD